MIRVKYYSTLTKKFFDEIGDAINAEATFTDDKTVVLDKENKTATVKPKEEKKENPYLKSGTAQEESEKISNLLKCVEELEDANAVLEATAHANEAEANYGPDHWATRFALDNAYGLMDEFIEKYGKEKFHKLVEAAEQVLKDFGLN